MFLAGVGLPVVMVAVDTLIQMRTPDRVRGRVGTAMEVAFAAPQTASIAAGAILVGILDYWVIFVIMFIVILLCAAYAAVRITERTATAVPPPSAVTADQAGVAT